MYGPHGVAARSTYTCGASGNASAGHDGSQPRYAAARPSNKPATMAGGVHGAHRAPWCTHTHVPARKEDAVFPSRPSHTKRPRIRQTAFLVHGRVAKRTHRAMQSAIAVGRGAILPAPAPTSLPIQATLSTGSGRDLGLIK